MKAKFTANLILIFALTVSANFAQESINNAANPCTTADAYQTVGKWGRQKKDDLAMADRNFPKEQYKPVLAKAQKVVDLFMKTHPEVKVPPPEAVALFLRPRRCATTG